MHGTCCTKQIDSPPSLAPFDLPVQVLSKGNGTIFQALTWGYLVQSAANGIRYGLTVYHLFDNPQLNFRSSSDEVYYNGHVIGIQRFRHSSRDAVLFELQDNNNARCSATLFTEPLRPEKLTVANLTSIHTTTSGNIIYIGIAELGIVVDSTLPQPMPGDSGGLWTNNGAVIGMHIGKEKLYINRAFVDGYKAISSECLQQWLHELNIL